MKKYIFISLCCLISTQLSAINIPQDSIYIYKGKIDPNIDMSGFDFNFDFPDMDTSDLLALREKFGANKADMEDWKESLKATQKQIEENFKDLKADKWRDVRVYKFNQKNKTPKSTETKSFSNISEIDFRHQYGNIIVKESKSKQVELQIQYFSSRNKKNPVNISTTKGLLTIDSKSTSGAEIDFIINIPRNTKLNINLRYGKVRMDEFHAPFSSNLSYSSLNAEGFSGVKPVIKDRYGKITIGQAQDIDIDASYSKVNIAKANRIDLLSNYSDNVFSNVQNLVIKGTSSGDFKIGTIGNISGNLNYADIKIDNLNSDLTTKCNYSDIQINSISSNANINVNSNYSDIILSIPSNIGATFSVSLNHGDINVSNKYSVKYTEHIEKAGSVIKKGQVGNKKATAVINVTSNYADVKIR